MYHHFFVNAGVGALELSGTAFLIAAAIFACLLGLELIGILLLVRRMLRASHEKNQKKAEQESAQKHYCGVPVVMLGILPGTAYVTLSVLICLFASVTVALLVILLIFRQKGYTFISSEDATMLEKFERAQKENQITVEAPVAPVVTEEERQDAYTETDDLLSAFDEPLVIPEDEEIWSMPLVQEEEAQEEQELDEQFAFEASETAQEVAEPEVLSQDQEEAPVLLAPADVREDRSFADGTKPYKIVEKIVTETQKEVVREVPVANPERSDAAEQLMEKLTDFLDYELQKRKESDLAETIQNQEDSVDAFAQKKSLAEDAEDEDEDELDAADDTAEDEDDDFDPDAPENEDRFTGNERIIGFDEATGCYIVAHYRKSFEAKLIQARPNIKQYYSELKNALLSYKGTKSRISWTADSFHNGRAQIAKINVKTNILELYLALEPESLEGTVYRGKNVGSKKKYADTPFQYKLRTPRKFKWALELVQRTCEEHGLSPIDIEKVDYEQQYPFESTETLVERKLIKEYIREEKPATTFELAPDHVPTLPDEDESVIPANANFLWELDNDMPAQEEEAVEETMETEEIEETVQDEPAAEAEEPAAEAEEPAEAPSSNVIKETVKITEVRYTERYYADAEPSYEQIITTQESILPAEAVESEEVASEEIEAEEIEAEEILEEAAEAFVPVEEEVEEENPLDEFFAEAPESEEVAFEESEETEETEETEGEFFFDEQPEEETEEVIYEEVYEEIYEEEPVEETEEVVYEEVYEEIYEEEPAEETEEVIYEEVYEEESDEDVIEVYEDDSEIVYEEVVYEDPSQLARPSKEKVAMDPSVAVIDICAVAEHFKDGDTVNLQSLMAKGLVVPTAKTLKIYAGGTLSKRLSVEAHHFSLEAIFAIGTVGGETSMLY